MPTGLGSRPTFSCSHPRSSRRRVRSNSAALGSILVDFTRVSITKPLLYPSELRGHRYDDLSTSMSLRETADRFGGLAQTMTAVDDRRHFPRLEESGQGDQVRLLQPRHEEARPLTCEPCKQRPGQHATQPAPDPAAVGSSDTRSDKYALGTQHAAACEKRMIRHQVEDQVVALRAPREVGAGVIDDAVGTDGTD